MATTMPSFVRASLSSPPLSNDTLDYSFRPDLKPFSVHEAVQKVKPMQLYETDIIHKGSTGSYQKLKEMVAHHLEHRHRDQSRRT